MRDTCTSIADMVILGKEISTSVKPLYRASPCQLFPKCTVYRIYGKQDWISIRGRFREILLLVFECNQAVKNKLYLFIYLLKTGERSILGAG